MKDFPKHNSCLISGSTDLRPMIGYEKDYLVKSKPVGFVFCQRIPTEKELKDHYDTYSREDYLSPITIKRFNELLDDLETYRKTGKLLDIGCGTGFFLQEAKKRGWEVYGTEFTDKAIEICKSKGIIMKQGKLDHAWFGEGVFDVIISFEVLEHINNPIEEVRNINYILRKGGIFYFTTPNFNALERFFLKSKYNIIEYPEHLAYYTKKTANYLFTSNNFKKKKISTTGISITRIRTSLKKNSGEALISPTSTDEKIRVSLEKNKISLLIKDLLNGILNFLGIGISLKGWYIKK
jgi:2-polyprenyl-3-methyl-5-hydroxy-6-metoxy-1,4-benzoquinol methylase